MSYNWRYDLRCDHCRRFMRVESGVAWEACGEFGQDIRYVCKACIAATPNFVPQASNGSRDARWCGFVTERAA